MKYIDKYRTVVIYSLIGFIVLSLFLSVIYLSSYRELTQIAPSSANSTDETLKNPEK
jgi:hypothetical protein